MASSDFWKTLPGIITAVATLIGSVTGLLFAAHQFGWIPGFGPGSQEEHVPGPRPEGCDHLGGELDDLGGRLEELHGQLENAHRELAHGNQEMEPEIGHLEREIGDVERHRGEVQRRFEELGCRR